MDPIFFMRLERAQRVILSVREGPVNVHVFVGQLKKRHGSWH